MLTIPKRKLYPARGLMWGGFVLVLAGLFAAMWSGGLPAALTLGGAAVSITGAAKLGGTYRCPACGHQLAPEGARINALLGRYAWHCPGCGKAVIIDIV